MGSDGSDEPNSFVWEDALDDNLDSTDSTDSNGSAFSDPPAETRATDSVDSPSTPVGLTSASMLDPERYLLAGETVDERIDVRRGWLVATSHRLLVFDPDSPGKRFDTVDRPNVVDVRMTGGGSPRVRAYALRAGLYAGVLLVGGLLARTLGLGSLFTANPDVGGTPGVGGLVSALSLVGTLVGLLVDLLFFGGLAVGLVAVALGVWYVRGRHPTLVVERAGAENLELELPSNAVGRRAVDGLERALEAELALDRA